MSEDGTDGDFTSCQPIPLPDRAPDLPSNKAEPNRSRSLSMRNEADEMGPVQPVHVPHRGPKARNGTRCARQGNESGLTQTCKQNCNALRVTAFSESARDWVYCAHGHFFSRELLLFTCAWVLPRVGGRARVVVAIRAEEILHRIMKMEIARDEASKPTL